jgi:Glycoside hydrolase 123, catalytic domain/Glycoside hydrolase 123 N-terminal domain
MEGVDLKFKGNLNSLVIVSSCLLLSAVPARSASGRLKLSFQSSVVKVFQDEPSPGTISTEKVSMARGEYQSFQFLVATQGDDLHDVTVTAGPLVSSRAAKAGAGIQVSLSLVGYVLTHADDRRPWHKITKVGWWPDPLLPNRPFDVTGGQTRPVWVTLFAPAGTPPGLYTGDLVVMLGQRRMAQRSYQVEVFNVTLPKKQVLRNAAFMPSGNLEAHYKVPGGIDGKPFLQLYESWARFAYQHHLGPAFDMLMGWNQTELRKSLEAGSLGPTPDMLVSKFGPGSHVTWPVHWNPKGYDFSTAEQLIDMALPYGLERFCIAIFDRQQQWEQQDPKTHAAMADFLRAYVSMLKTRGLDRYAYVYNADEPGPRMWDTVKKNYEFVKSVDPQLKTWLCLNNLNGVRALAGFTDMWDVYIRQYDQSGVEQNRKAGETVIWGVCVYPHEHPNLFIEYPAMDARIIGWLTYAYQVTGFEYWGLNQWGPNTGHKDWASFGKGSTHTSWQRTRWPLGDGWLLNPGPHGEPLSSVRFENVRDGFEDAELLLMLNAGGKKAEGRQIAARVARSPEDYTSDPAAIEAAHVAVLKALVKTNSK